MKQMILVMILNFFVMPSVSAETITSALESSYLNNTQLAEKRAELRARDNDVSKALSGWRPTITANAKFQPSKAINWGAAKELPSAQSGSTQTQTQIGVTFQQNLFKGGETIASTSLAENTVKAAKAGLIAFEQTILLQAIQAYLELFSKTAELDLLRGNEVVLQQTLDATINKFNVGEETRTSVAQAEAKLADGVAKRQTAEAEFESLKAIYERITNKKPDTLQKPELVKNIPSTFKDVLEYAQKSNPTIIAAQFEEIVSRYTIEQAKAGWRPRVDVSVSSTRTESRSKQQYVTLNSSIRSNGRDTNHALTLEASIPLYEAGSVSSDIRKAHETSEQKRIAVETVRRQVQEQASQMWQNFIAAKANIDSYNKQVKANQINLEGTKQEMYVGSKILLEVLRAQSELVEAQVKLVKEEQKYYFEAFRLLAVMGLLTVKNLKLNVDYYDPEYHYREVRDQW